MNLIKLKKIIKGFLFLFCLSAAAYSQAPVAGADRLQTTPTDYKIHQGDKLSVRFLYQPELNEASLVVRPDGFISLQMIDDIRAEGLTVPELKKRLEKAYEEILLKPSITVTLLEFVAPRIYIGGQVNKPGRYDLRDGQTLVQAIFLAGGFTGDANKKLVIYARRRQGEWQIQSTNVMQILSKKEAKKDVPPDVMLEDGDYIFVPESKISQFNKAVESFTGLLPRIL